MSLKFDVKRGTNKLIEMNLIELQSKIHEQNKAMGWWDEPRPFHMMACLIDSELSEAMEGDRKNLMDDHLPSYPMFQVELADFVIRCLDYLCSTGFDESDWDDVRCQVGDYWSTCNIKSLMDMKVEVITAYKRDSGAHFGEAYDCLGRAVIIAISQANYMNFDLHKIILEKAEYNKHRADHKRENRAKVGGKKY